MNSSAERHRVVVIGAGMGGLAAAIRLAGRGYAVTVVEKEASVGGKARHVMAGDVPVDGGPTVMTMKWAFDRLLSPLGMQLADLVELRSADLLARHFWPDGSQLDLFADIDTSVEAIRDFSDAHNAKGYRDFCQQSRAIFETLKDTYIAGQRPNPLQLVNRIGPTSLGKMLALKPFDTLWSALGAHFTDPRLRQLFGRYATYCGSSPFACPATLMLVAHVEQDGVWLVNGGMHALARALQDAAESIGVRFVLGADVSGITTTSVGVSGVTINDGDVLSCESIVFNGDVSALTKPGFEHVGQQAGISATPPAKRSLSALVWSATVPAGELPLAHHTVCFGDAYASEFDAVFKRGAVPDQPTVYMCAQDRTCDGMLSAAAKTRGTERLLILVNAPANGDGANTHFSIEEINACQHAMITQVNRCAVPLSADMLTTAKLTTPSGFNRLFPATGGALYGRANHGPMASFQRPGARTKLSGLYLAGGSVHPGPGVPMAAISGQLAADCLAQDHALTR